MERSGFDLEQRLLMYAVQVIKLVDQLPSTRANNHISKQLLRSGTSPLPNHGEAQAAEAAPTLFTSYKFASRSFEKPIGG